MVRDINRFGVPLKCLLNCIPDHGLGVDGGPVGRPLGLLPRLGMLVHLQLALVKVRRRGLLPHRALNSWVVLY